MALRVAVIITARPSYAKAKTVIQALVRRGVDVQIICAASALLERYGRVRDVIAKDFPDVPITECWSTYEGANLLTSAKETGALLSELGSALHRMRPDRVVGIADRHEVLAAAQSAAYLHLCFTHLQGGETSGSIDNKVRDSITQLADVHCVCTERAKWRVYGLTGSDRVYHTGCPSIDLARQALSDPPVTFQEIGGTGYRFNLSGPFLVILQHPVTTEMDQAAEQMLVTLEATHGHRRLVFWAGQDAGAENSAKVIRTARDVHAVRNLPPSRFLRLLTQAACLVGNSSAGIRESSFLGVPVVNIGSRQQGRERGPNVIDVPHERAQIAAAVERQVEHGRYPSSALYGRGDAGERIGEVICGQ